MTDSFGEVFLSVDMDDYEESLSEDPSTQVSQVLGRRATTKRKQEEAFERSPPPQLGQAEVGQHSPKPKKDRPQAALPQTSSPKAKAKSGDLKSMECRESLGRTHTQKSASVNCPTTTQQPSPMSRVTCLDTSKQGKVALRKHPDNQHLDKSDCGCHTCIRELAVIKYQPIDRKGAFSHQFKECVGNRQIYSLTDLKLHPESCLCKTHLEKEWSHSSPGSGKAPSPQATVQKITGVVSSLLKKLEPNRAEGTSRLPRPTESARNHASGTNRTPHQDNKLREANTAPSKREDPRTGKPPLPMRTPKSRQVKETTIPSGSKEPGITNIPVRTSR